MAAHTVSPARLPLITMALLLLFAPAAARPSQPVDHKLVELRTLEQEIESAAGDAQLRANAEARAIELRERLLAESLDDVVRAELLIAQIESALRLLSRDATDLSVLFGIPTTDQRARVQDSALRLIKRSEEARTLLATLIRDADLASQRGQDESDSPDLATKYAQQHDVQIPMRRGRALMLLASATPDPELRRRLARQAIEQVEQVPPVSDWVDVELGVILGLCHSLLGEFERASRELNVAEESIAQSEHRDVLQASRGAEIVLARISAMLASDNGAEARAELGRAIKNPPFVIEGRIDPMLALIAADVRFRIDHADVRHASTRQARELALAQAFGVYERLLIRSDLAEYEASLWPLVEARIASLCDEQTQFDVLPPIVALAAASEWSRDPDRRAQSIMILESLLARGPEELSSLRPYVLMQLISLLVRGTEEELARSVELVTLMHEAYPTHELGGAALGAVAAALVAQRDRMRTSQGMLTASQEDALLQTLRAIHTSLVQVENIETWRRILVDLLIEQAQGSGTEQAIALLREASLVASAIDIDSLSALPAIQQIAVAAMNTMRATERASDATAVTRRHNLAAVIESVTRGAQLPLHLPDSPEDQQRLESSLLYCQTARGAALLALHRDDDARELLEAVSAELGSESVELAAVRRTLARAYGRLGAISELSLLVDAAASERPSYVRELLSEATADGWRIVSANAEGFVADRESLVDEHETIELLNAAVGWMRQHEPSAVAVMQEQLAWALLVYGEPDRAAALFGELLQQRSNSAPLLRGLGEAELLRGDDAGAFAAFRRLAQLFEGSGKSHELYWHSWARMLEILERQNGDGSRAITIRREIRRLLQYASVDAYPEASAKIRDVAASVDLTIRE